ncbi:MAG: hypothetical protein B7Y39_06510 [Bdellovibrio sp. 28-41-41]|nr:MAG: hypothetical protein B7Y39_06510 [Bdellovibrio sp. 28-41-41]
MGRYIVLFYLLTLTFSHVVWGADCSSLKDDLKQMRAAQSQITENLLGNYKSAAEQVSYAAIKMHSDSTKQRLYVREQALRSAKAHAKRVEKTEVIINKLNRATDELIKKVAACVK